MIVFWNAIGYNETMVQVKKLWPIKLAKRTVQKSIATQDRAAPVLCGEENWAVGHVQDSLRKNYISVYEIRRDIDVRLMLAARLVALMPDLTEEQHARLYAYTVQTLGTMALDEILKIRLAFTSALRDFAFIPPKEAGNLALNIERDVSETILRFCTAVPDEDLIEILKGLPADWMVEPIAQRSLSARKVSKNLLQQNNETVNIVLMSDENINKNKLLLKDIVAKSKAYNDQKVVSHAKKILPLAIERELSIFIDQSARDVLLNRAEYDAQMAEDIVEVFRRRLNYSSEFLVLSDVDRQTLLSAWLETDEVKDIKLGDALAMRDEAFVYAALAQLMEIPENDLREIVRAAAPRPIIALCWRAGLAMRTALLIQKDLAKISHNRLIYPKDGEDYPLSEDQIGWQLEYLGLAVNTRKTA